MMVVVVVVCDGGGGDGCLCCRDVIRVCAITIPLLRTLQSIMRFVMAYVSVFCVLPRGLHVVLADPGLDDATFDGLLRMPSLMGIGASSPPSGGRRAFAHLALGRRRFVGRRWCCCTGGSGV